MVRRLQLVVDDNGWVTLCGDRWPYQGAHGCWHGQHDWQGGLGHYAARHEWRHWQTDEQKYKKNSEHDLAVRVQGVESRLEQIAKTVCEFKALLGETRTVTMQTVVEAEKLLKDEHYKTKVEDCSEPRVVNEPASWNKRNKSTTIPVSFENKFARLEAHMKGEVQELAKNVQDIRKQLGVITKVVKEQATAKAEEAKNAEDAERPAVAKQADEADQTEEARKAEGEDQKDDDDRFRQVRQKLTDEDFKNMLDWMTDKGLEFDAFVKESRQRRSAPAAAWLKRVRLVCAQL
eukprot:TRINITY_DN35672_c0_g1_i1.p1 TRINITY_DN35672_c0_g1~~TRINITY_DN35672_c0_g1_i1.p1  ORF type:complete len:290 (-),score=83.22 TRINITY_DN35672_c0_g1_i1:121-990(-)